jgi:hypothetical protein
MKIFIAIAILVVGLVATGCSGGAEEATSTAAAAAPAAAPDGAAAGDAKVDGAQPKLATDPSGNPL